jgi:hypothetical protein
MSSSAVEKNRRRWAFDISEYRLQLGSDGALTLDLVVGGRVSQARGGPVAGFFEQVAPLYYS